MNLDPDVIKTLVTFLTGGGLIALITGVIRSVRTVRTGALSSTRAVVKGLVEARNEAEDREDAQRRRADYWQDVAGRYSFQLRRAGVTPDPRNPMPPPVTAEDRREARQERDRQRIEDSGDIMS